MSEAHLRMITMAFRERMLEKLLMHPERGTSWKDTDAWDLYDRLGEELKELKAAIECGTPEQVAEEAADVANFAMMIADVERGLA